MAQIKKGVSVTNGSQTVTVTGDLTSRIRKNHTFMVEGELVPYTVAADPTYSAGTGQTTIKLTGAYMGATNASAAGVFVVDVTYPDMIPTISQGDVGTAAIFTQAMFRVQDLIHTVSPAGLQQYTDIRDEVFAIRNDSAVSAAEAASSQAKARTSETNAATSAAAAATSAANAKTSETNAKSSETNAKTSETNASTSAATAQKWATQTSAEVVAGQGYGAKKYANDAAGSASAAAGSASTASTKAGEAATSATTASTKAGEAATSASNAATSASNAATSATTATTKAGEAATSASNAATSATTASTKAGEAATSASNAATSKTGADTAKTAAETAKTAAETAKTAAETAKTAAETARDTAKDWATKLTTTVDGTSFSAKQYALNAAGSASTATTKAGEASTSASDAASAKTAAETAKAAAETAKTAAETAKTGAETARTGAETAKTLAEKWATQTGSPVDGTNYGAKKYAADAKAEADRAYQAAESAVAGQVNADWNATSGKALILNKPNLHAIATSGNKADIGLGSVENKSSATIRSELNAQNVSKGLSNNPFGGNPVNGTFNWLAYALGNARCLYDDDEFAAGVNSVGVYNNLNNGTVTITRKADATAPNKSGYVLEIVSTTGTAEPGRGGFVQDILSRANGIFVQRFRAKIPVGFTLRDAQNSMGTNSVTYWATPQAGTGKWEDYIRVTECGNTGTFSGGGHVYLEGAGAVTWHLASCSVWDMTDRVKLWHDKNDGAGSGLDADLLDGYQSDTTANGDTIARRTSSGHLYGTYFNTTHAQATRNSDTVFYSSTDGFIYKNTKAGFLTSLGLNNVENKSSATIRGELTDTNVVTALGWGSLTGLQGQARITAAADFNADLPSGFYEYDSAANAPSTGWFNMINVRHSNRSNQHGFQIAQAYGTDGLYHRRYSGGTSGSTGSFQSWKKILDSGNYNDYAPTKTGGGASGTWGIAITGRSGYTRIHDTESSGFARNANNILPTMFAQETRWDFVTSTSVNMPGNYAGLQTIVPYTGTTASTGGPSYQVAYGCQYADANGVPLVRIRPGIDSSWKPWWSFMLAGGTGATGQNFNSLVSPGVHRVENGVVNGPSGGSDYGNVLVMRSPNHDTITQIYGHYSNSDLFARSGNPSDTGGSGSWQAWVRLLSSANYGDYAPRKDGTGAAGTWGIDITGRAARLAAGYVAGGLSKPNSGQFGGGNVRAEMLSQGTFPNGSNAVTNSNYWLDTLWLSTYNGSDVKGSNVLIMGKQNDFVGFARQDFDAATWGEIREILHTGNMGKHAPALSNYTAINVTDANLNNLTNTGFFRGERLANAPEFNTGWFYVLVESHDTNWLKQTATSFGSGNTANRTYTRARVGGNWTAWERLATGTDLANAVNTAALHAAILSFK